MMIDLDDSHTYLLGCLTAAWVAARNGREPTDWQATRDRIDSILQQIEGGDIDLMYEMHELIDEAAMVTGIALDFERARSSLNLLQEQWMREGVCRDLLALDDHGSLTLEQLLDLYPYPSD